MGKKLNLLGKTFYYLTVLEETEQRNNRGSVIWKCKCKCGNITYASSTEITKGKKKSCGCYQREIAARVGRNNLKNLVGQKFGLLTVISKNNERSGSKIYWNCSCDCGNDITVVGQSLVSGNTRSCGCIKSFGEQKIANLLRDANISFEKEKVFADATTSRKGYMRFDFFVDNKYIIEYDGKQHFQDSSWGDSSLTKEEAAIKDNEKNEYCLTHNLPIIRIPYTHYLQLELKDLLLETSNFII